MQYVSIVVALSYFCTHSNSWAGRLLLATCINLILTSKECLTIRIINSTIRYMYLVLLLQIFGDHICVRVLYLKEYMNTKVSLTRTS